MIANSLRDNQDSLLIAYSNRYDKKYAERDVIRDRHGGGGGGGGYGRDQPYISSNLGLFEANHIHTYI